MPLSDVQCRNAKSGEKAWKLTDGEGLCLFVKPNGSKLWRQDYAFDGKRKTASFGPYPEVSLAQARAKRDELKTAIKEGRDPAAKLEDTRPTFEKISREWFATNVTRWKTGYSAALWKRVERDILTKIGSKPIEDITPLQVLEALREVEKRDAIYTARRLHQMTSQIFKYAVVHGHTRFNPAADLHVALKPVPKEKHRSALKADELPDFFVKLKNTPMEESTRLALKAVAHVFVRTDEIRFGKWSEFDFQKDVWTIPAPRMKMKREFKVPLSRQAKAIFQQLQKLANGSEWVLPGPRTGQPVSANTLLFSLYRAGYHSRATVHGFRSTFSTIANESELWDRDAIEHQLAHAPDDAIRAAYDRGERWQTSVKMMQWYSDLLERYERKGIANDLTDLLGPE